MSYQNILDASFKGVHFFVENESLQAFGRRIVNHEYPNTSEQFSEDVGGFPDNFTVEGFVIGEDAKDQFEAIKNACNEKGAGRLVLGHFGERKVIAGKGTVSVKPYITVDKITFTIEFYVSRDKAGFVESTASAEQCFAFGDRVRATVAKNFTYGFGDNSSSALYDFNSILTSIQNLLFILPPQYIGNVSTLLNIAYGDAQSLINNPHYLISILCGNSGLYSIISSSIIGFAGNTDNIGTIGNGGGAGGGGGAIIYALLAETNNFEKRLPTGISAFSKAPQTTTPINGGVNYWQETTPDRTLRNAARRNLVDAHKLNLLTIAYEQLASTTFLTEQDAEKAKADVESAYIDMLHGIDGIVMGIPLLNGSDTRSELISSPEVLPAFEALRLAAIETIDKSQIALYKVETAKLLGYYGISILNLSYLSQAENIKNENDLLDITRTMYEINGRQAYELNGDVSVLRRL